MLWADTPGRVLHFPKTLRHRFPWGTESTRIIGAREGRGGRGHEAQQDAAGRWEPLKQKINVIDGPVR